MLVYLGALTECMCRPPVDVCINPGPHVPSCDHVLSGTNSWVGQGMESTKDSPSEQLWDVEAACASAHVVEQGNISSWEGHRAKLKR